MANFNLQKGHNLKIAGEPTKVLSTTISADKVYLHPKDFIGIKPKLLVKQDDVVSVGSPIYFEVSSNLVFLISLRILACLKRRFSSIDSGMTPATVLGFRSSSNETKVK